MIDKILNERGERYGLFSSHAMITQCLKEVMQGAIDDAPTNWKSLNASQREALEMIAHKIGRILNGDPNYDDNWVDIAGYSELVVKELESSSKSHSVNLGEPVMPPWKIKELNIECKRPD